MNMARFQLEIKLKKNDLALLPYSPNINQDYFATDFFFCQNNNKTMSCLCLAEKIPRVETTHVIVAPAPAIVFSRFQYCFHTLSRAAERSDGKSLSEPKFRRRAFVIVLSLSLSSLCVFVRTTYYGRCWIPQRVNGGRCDRILLFGAHFGIFVKRLSIYNRNWSNCTSSVCFRKHIVETVSTLPTKSY